MIQNRLLQIRENLRFEIQKDFADFLELSQMQYSRFERNERQPTIDTAYDICKKLNMKFEDIFYDTRDSKK